MGLGYGFDVFSVVFPLLFGGMFLLVFGLILWQVVRSVRQSAINRSSPRIIVEAVVTAKRTQTSHSMHNPNDTMHAESTWTHYWATFELESGDRMELSIPENEIGLLAEGDRGKLTFQGTQYISFVRHRA